MVALVGHYVKQIYAKPPGLSLCKIASQYLLNFKVFYYKRNVCYLNYVTLSR